MLFIIYKEHIYVTKIFLSFVRPSPFVSPAPSHQHLAWFAYVHTKVQRLQLYFHCSPPCSGVKSCLEPTSIILGIFQSEANYLLYKKILIQKIDNLTVKILFSKILLKEVIVVFLIQSISYYYFFYLPGRLLVVLAGLHPK